VYSTKYVINNEYIGKSIKRNLRIKNKLSTKYFIQTVRAHIYIYIYRVSQEECARLREGVPYAKIYRYNSKHLCPKWNGYGDNGQRSLKL